MNISKNLEDYVKVYENIFDKTFCINTVNELEKANWKLHSYTDIHGEEKSYENDLSVTYHNFTEHQIIQNQLWHVLERYILQDFKDLAYFDGWHGYSVVRFNKYDANTQMQLHCDHIHDLFDNKGVPVLSMVGSLNDDYEGGEFYMWGDTEIKIPAGSVCVFPSNFLYPHEVKEIKNGTRFSYVSWAW